MTNSNWQDSNKFKEQKPLHARIIKFIDGKVFLFCFILVFFFIQQTSFHPSVGDKSTEKEKCPCKVLPSSDSHLYSNKVQQFRKLIIEFRAKSLFYDVLA